MLHLLDTMKAMEAQKTASAQAPAAPLEAAGHPVQPMAAQPIADQPMPMPPHIPNVTPAQMPVEEASDEERGEERKKVFKRGKITYASGNFEVECQIRDLNTTGAKLRLSGEVTVPSCFDLIILPEKIVKKAQVCWKEELTLGIRFIEPE
jgi:hypothetical protein